MIYNQWAATSTDYVPRYDDLVEASNRLLKIYEDNLPVKKSFVKYSEHVGNFKKYEIYVTVQYLETTLGFDVLSKQITKIWIKVYKKDKLLVEKTIECEVR